VKPLVSKDAAMVAYPPTNTIILTDTAANIRRLLSILEAIDVETYKQDLAVIKVKHADADTLGEQISQIYGAEVSGAAARTTRRTRTTSRRTSGQTPEMMLGAAGRGQVRIITDARTNSLLVLASRPQLEEIRGLVRKLDVPVTGGGTIRVYYLKHADAEELAQTLNSLLSGQRAPAAPGRTGAATTSPQALRSVITELAEGVTVTADPATNSLVIQASKEAYETVAEVIGQLDIVRPQVLVEALIMEVDVTDGEELGFNAIYQIVNGNFNTTFVTNTDPATAALAGASGGLAFPLLVNSIGGTLDGEDPDDKGTLIQGVLKAAADDDNINIVSAPHILTSDNEEAEIKIGANIPIITSRVESAQATTESTLATSVNVERQDIGVTLRVTPQISEGDTLRLKIFQELTAVNETLSDTTGETEDVGVSLTNRKIENTVVVADGQTVVIGGLISDSFEDLETKVPFLGDIPVLGWAFKSVSRKLRKENLLVLLTPHIVRDEADLVAETIRKRREFELQSDKPVELGEEEDAEEVERDPVRARLQQLDRSYPLERMREIEEAKRAERARVDEAARLLAEAGGPRYEIRAEVFRDADRASETLTELLDAGYDGTLVSGETDGFLLFELLVGPFPTLEEAESASAVLREAYGLSPAVTVLQPEAP
jgi:general secretion pathway protein D